jgi:hypothetical protein
MIYLMVFHIQMFNMMPFQLFFSQVRLHGSICSCCTWNIVICRSSDSLQNIKVSDWFLQGIWVAYSHNPSAITLPVWVVISGGTYGLFAFFVPTLHSLRLYTAVSIFLSLIFICIAVGTSFNDGMKLPPTSILVTLLHHIQRQCWQSCNMWLLGSTELILKMRNWNSASLWFLLHMLCRLQGCSTKGLLITGYQSWCVLQINWEPGHTCICIQ